MKRKTDATKIWQEYERGVAYNHSINLYDTVKKNENFFIGNQWEGVDAPDLDKPVFNILKRVCNLFVSMLVSDDITATVEPFFKGGDSDAVMRVVTDEIEKAIEYSKVKQKNRDVLRNACVDGDGCMYVYFNPDSKTGQLARGMIDVDVIDNTNIIFANPQVHEIQRQPYIMLLQRRSVESVKEEARANGVGEDEISKIMPDSESDIAIESESDDKVSVIIKFRRKNGKIYCSKTTANAIVREEYETGYSLFPVAFMQWEKVKNQYHGQAAVTGLIPNQIFVNKCYAMGMDYIKKLAFPKLIYDKNKFPYGFDSRIGKAIAVEGNVGDAVISAFKMPDMSGQVMQMVDNIMGYTKEYMGVSDATLGNVRPDNTSAIIAVQKATSAPLELMKMAFYQFVEDYIRIFVDIMRVNYGLRKVEITDDMNQKRIIDFDFGILNNYVYNLKVNVGAAAYWSELMQVQTADNLFQKGIIKDAEMYLDCIPDSYVKNKQDIINNIREQKALAAAQAQSTAPGQMPPMMQ